MDKLCKLGVNPRDISRTVKMEVKLLLGARHTYMLRRLAQQQMTLSDLELHHPHRALSLF